MFDAQAVLLGDNQKTKSSKQAITDFLPTLELFRMHGHFGKDYYKNRVNLGLETVIRSPEESAVAGAIEDAKQELAKQIAYAR